MADFCEEEADTDRPIKTDAQGLLMKIYSVWNILFAYFHQLSSHFLKNITTKLSLFRHWIQSFTPRCKRCYLVRGSPNLGSTCFFNAVLQNLLATDVLRNYFLESVSDESFAPLSASIRKLYLETNVKGGGELIDPRTLFGNICTKFPDIYITDKGGNCRKLLKNLVLGLSNEAFIRSKNSSGAEKMSVAAMFRVKQANVTCSNSGHPSVSYTTRLFLGLEVPESRLQSKKTWNTARCSRDNVDQVSDISPVSIESCLDLYMNPKHQTIEKSEDCSKDLHERMINALKTNSCKSEKVSGKQAKNLFNVKRDVAKITLISSPPPILMIQFDKVMYKSNGKPYTTAFEGHVKFGDALDLKPYMDPRYKDTEDGSCIYRLTGLVEIICTESESHAVAYVRGNTGNGRYVWYYVSDDELCEVPVEEVLSCEANILFYERC